jgi:hypothetical protein
MSAPAPAAVPEPQSTPRGWLAHTWERVHAYRESHAKTEIAVFFLAGFLFDVVTLSRIDDLLTILQQGGYLALLALLLGLAERQEHRGDLPALLAKGMRFGEDAIHFFFGSLLSSFALFYFKSASGIGALIFVVVLFAVLVANELPQFRKLGPVMRFAIFSFALTSYFAYLFPTAAGFLSPWLFVLASAVACLCLGGVYALLRRWGIDKRWVLARAVLPAAGVQVLLVSLYFLHAIPPVPLSIDTLGLYHGVEKVKEGKGDLRMLLLNQRPWWRVWHHGDQEFVFRPGDKLYGFASVFAPQGFKDRIFMRWKHQNVHGEWETWDRIPVTVVGNLKGRYRIFTNKAKFEEGAWRVEVETEDERTIGSLRFTAVPEAPPAEGQPWPPRVFRIDEG